MDGMVPSFVRLKEREIDMSINARVTMTITKKGNTVSVSTNTTIQELSDSIADVIAEAANYDKLEFTIEVINDTKG